MNRGRFMGYEGFVMDLVIRVKGIGLDCSSIESCLVSNLCDWLVINKNAEDEIWTGFINMGRYGLLCVFICWWIGNVDFAMNGWW